MPVTIPTPLGAPPRRRQDPFQQLLLGLVGQAGSLGLQRLIQPNAPATPQSLADEETVQASVLWITVFQLT